MFNVGDKIVVTNPEPGESYSSGDTGTVIKVSTGTSRWVDVVVDGYVYEESRTIFTMYWKEVNKLEENLVSFEIGDKVIPSFTVGDRVKFKKSSTDSGMIDATEDDVFEIRFIYPNKTIKLWNDTQDYHINHFEHVEEEIMEEQKINWEVGQEVWDVRYGRGIVDTLLAIPCKYPIGVVFTDGGTASYTSKGLNRCTDVYRSLFFSEPIVTAELFPPKKTFVPTLKKGDTVVVNTHLGSICHRVNEETETHLDCDGQRYAKQKITSIFKLGEEIKFS